MSRFTLVVVYGANAYVAEGVSAEHVAEFDNLVGRGMKSRGCRVSRGVSRKGEQGA